jgi:hypothetical protein
MNQRSREAMAGKLRIYADRGRPVERCLASSDVRLSRTMEDKCEADGRNKIFDSREQDEWQRGRV